MTNEVEGLKKIGVILLDVDGVLTDGAICFSSHEEELKIFHALDGLGIVLAKAAGLRVGFVTARKSRVVDRRAKELALDIVIQGAMNKNNVLPIIRQRFGVSDEAICYVGDDLIDIPILSKVGFPVAVRNAVQEVKDIAQYVTEREGGRGAVREVIELVLKGQGKWDKLIEQFSK